MYIYEFVRGIGVRNDLLPKCKFKYRMNRFSRACCLLALKNTEKFRLLTFGGKCKTPKPPSLSFTAKQIALRSRTVNLRHLSALQTFSFSFFLLLLLIFLPFCYLIWKFFPSLSLYLSQKHTNTHFYIKFRSKYDRAVCNIICFIFWVEPK